MQDENTPFQSRKELLRHAETVITLSSGISPRQRIVKRVMIAAVPFQMNIGKLAVFPSPAFLACTPARSGAWRFRGFGKDHGGAIATQACHSPGCAVMRCNTLPFIIRRSATLIHGSRSLSSGAGMIFKC
ncbi:MAG: hypothetical protein LBE06_09960 [Azoarcus sp.]|jgi:hypothetical protein|nr:hypothetical protein [Azoarcus sp.]